MRKVADSFAGGVPLDPVRFESAVDLRRVVQLAALARANAETIANAQRSVERARRLRRKAARLPVGSNGRRKVEAEIARLEGRA